MNCNTTHYRANSSSVPGDPTGWKARGWKTADKKPVKNDDLWKRLDAARARHTVKWHWVKGHAGHALNERADQLANRGIEEMRAAQRS